MSPISSARLRGIAVVVKKDSQVNDVQTSPVQGLYGSSRIAVDPRTVPLLHAYFFAASVL